MILISLILENQANLELMENGFPDLDDAKNQVIKSFEEYKK